MRRVDSEMSPSGEWNVTQGWLATLIILPSGGSDRRIKLTQGQ